MAKDTLTFAATGRRKTAVARVRFSEGSGNITVNGLEANKYFDTALQQELLKKPFESAGNLRLQRSSEDVPNVNGGRRLKHLTRS